MEYLLFVSRENAIICSAAVLGVTNVYQQKCYTLADPEVFGHTKCPQMHGLCHNLLVSSTRSFDGEERSNIARHTQPRFCVKVLKGFSN